MSNCYSKGGMVAPKVSGATNHSGKGAQEQILPHRMAMNQLTKGDPSQRTMNNYAKATPGLGQESPSITGMGPNMGNPYD